MGLFNFVKMPEKNSGTRLQVSTIKTISEEGAGASEQNRYT